MPACRRCRIALLIDLIAKLIATSLVLTPHAYLVMWQEPKAVADSGPKMRDGQMTDAQIAILEERQQVNIKAVEDLRQRADQLRKDQNENEARLSRLEAKIDMNWQLLWIVTGGVVLQLISSMWRYLRTAHNHPGGK